MAVAILAFLGVPIWVCAVIVLRLIWRNRALQRRPGDIALAVLPDGNKRWQRGHGLWISDVFTFHGTPAVWLEQFVWGDRVDPQPEATWSKNPRRLGDDIVFATLFGRGGEVLHVATAAPDRAALLGPFAELAGGPAS